MAVISAVFSFFALPFRSGKRSSKRGAKARGRKDSKFHLSMPADLRKKSSIISTQFSDASVDDFDFDYELASHNTLGRRPHLNDMLSGKVL